MFKTLNGENSFPLQVTSWGQHKAGGRGQGAGGGKVGIRQLDSGCVTLGKLLSFSGLWFLLLQSNLSVVFNCVPWVLDGGLGPASVG